jgi:hypothetical protein
MLARIHHPTARTLSFPQRACQRQQPIKQRTKPARASGSGLTAAAGRRALVVAAMADLAEFEKTKGEWGTWRQFVSED